MAKVNLAAFGGAHTAGIFSDMTVDGPVIGTLVAIIDRARNLPNKRTMGKQDPYCAARLGKEAKKTATDKRGGQTPRWDQELRFTVHDSPDYHRIKVSVFNDDRKTELIGDTFIALDHLIHPGGGQSDGWHTLDCKGKYAGEIRIEFTYYDTRPKADKAEKRRDPTHAQTDGGQSPAAANNTPRGARAARESSSTPVIKRRPLPSDPTASSSPAVTPEHHRGLQGVRAGPRELGSPRHAESREQPVRRPAVVPEVSSHTPPAAAVVPSPRSSNPSLPTDAFDMSYAAPKPYEVKPVEVKPVEVKPVDPPRRLTEPAHRAPPADVLHAHSAPAIPTQLSFDPEYDDPDYDDPSYHVAPLRSSRSNLRQEPSFDDTHSRRKSAMQPTVEDEDFDLPPPPPAHRKDAATIPHSHSFTANPYVDSLHFTRHDAPDADYDYRSDSRPDYRPTERRYTHPRPAVQTNSRPVSRDAMAPSPLRQETSLPAALVAGFDPSRGQRDSYHAPPAYDTPPRLRQYSEPAEYRAPPDYTAPVQPHELVHYHAQPHDYYEHDPPEEPRRRSPVNEYAPVYRPRAHSPSPRRSPNPPDERSRIPTRTMPTRKSVSPRPPPPDEDLHQRRLSGVPFGPDDFNVLNPSLAKSTDEPERPGSSMEYNDKGQIVTFSGRVVDASDHLPIDNWAPEPEPKGTVKDKAPRIRAQLNGSRGLQDAQAREDRYRRDRAERDRIRSAADVTFGAPEPQPSTALVMTRRPDYDNSLVLADRPVSRGYDRPVSRGYEYDRPVSRGYEYDRPVSRGYDHDPRGYQPPREALRERHSPNYATAAQHPRAPPIPAKIPLDRALGQEDVALSLELQTIDIGPASARPRRAREGRREYGAFV